jgi:hypothetical protein
MVDAIPPLVLADLGTSLCGVPPKELNMAALLPQAED